MTDQDGLQETLDFWRLMDVSEGIELLRSYLEGMEAIVESHMSKASQEDDGGFKDQFTEIVLARILRKSFFLVLYGFLESRLNQECKIRKEARDDILLSLSNIRGSKLERAKIYLTKVLKVDCSFATPEWNVINNYRRLRNCIVHNDGVLSDARPDRDRENLRKFVAGKGTLRSDGDEIVIAKGFCEEALQTIECLLLSLTKAT